MVGVSRILMAMFARLLIIVVTALSLLACESRADLYQVVKVQDGDSLIVIDARGQQHKVRLSAVDAPEYRQPYGDASKQSLRGLLKGSEVKLNVLKTDQYGRLVAVVWAAPADCRDCDKTLDAGLYQVENGFAWWYRYWGKTRNEQSLAVQQSYERAEKLAKQKKLGLWRDANPVNPREWRKRHSRK